MSSYLCPCAQSYSCRPSKRRKKPPDPFHFSLLFFTRLYSGQTPELARQFLRHFFQISDLGDFLGLDSISARLLPRPSVVVTGSIFLCLLSWLGQVIDPDFGCRPSSDYCSSTWLVPVGHISRAICRRIPVRGVSFLKSVSAQNSASVTYGKSCLRCCTYTGIRQVWVLNSLCYGVYPIPFFSVLALWWYGCPFSCCSILVDVALFPSALHCGDGRESSVQIKFSVNWIMIQWTLNPYLVLCIHMLWNGFPLCFGSFGLRLSSWGTLIPVRTGFSDINEGFSVSLCSAIHTIRLTLALSCVVQSLPWLTFSPPFHSLFGLMHWGWTVMLCVVSSLSLRALTLRFLSTTLVLLTFIWLWWQGPCFTSLIFQPMSMRLPPFFCKDQHVHMLRMHLCMLGV